MRNDTQKIKLLALCDVLCKHTDEDRHMHTDEIIAALNEKGMSASRKVLPQNIELLNAYGYKGMTKGEKPESFYWHVF